MSKKITVIGAGSVGSATAFALAMRNIANEIVIIDINEDRALGEAMDIRQGTPLLSEPVTVYAGNYEDAAGSDIVVITSGVARKPGQTRMDLASTNVNIIKSASPPNIVRTLSRRHLRDRGQPRGHPHLCVYCKISGLPERPGHRLAAPFWTPRVCAPASPNICPHQPVRTCTPTYSASTATHRLCPGRIASVSSIKLEQYRKDLIKLTATASAWCPNLDCRGNRKVHAHLRRQDHCAQGLPPIYAIVHFRMPHHATALLRQSVTRGDDGFLHAARRIRPGRRVPEPLAGDAGQPRGHQGQALSRRLTDEEIAKLHYSAQTALKDVISQLSLD